MTTPNQNTQAQQDAIFNEASEGSRALATTLNAITLDQLQLSEQVGAVKAFDFTKKLMTVSTIKILAEIKESKKYKGLQLPGYEGKPLTVSSWEEFCQAINKSRQHIDEEIRNLSAFGEDFLENSRRMGIGYRDLRKLRKIPEDVRELIINGQAIAESDKDALVDLIEDMSVKHSKEKSKLKKELKSSNQESKAKDAVIKQKQNTIDNKNDELIKMDEKIALKLNAPAYDRAKDYAAKMDVIKIDALQLFGSINALFEHIEQDAELPELLRVNQGHLLMELNAQANNLIDHYYLGDVSVDDDDLSWVDEANAAIAERNAQNEPVLVDPIEKQATREDDAEVFQKWKQDQGYVSDDDSQ